MYPHIAALSRKASHSILGHNEVYGTDMKLSEFYCESFCCTIYSHVSPDEISDYYYWRVCVWRRSCCLVLRSDLEIQNPHWGSAQETGRKMREFYGTDRLYNTKPIPGAREGVEALKQLGFRLIIVTARFEDTADQSWEWAQRHFPGERLSDDLMFGRLTWLFISLRVF